MTGDSDRMRQLAAGYAEEIDEIAAKNSELRISNAQLEAENKKLTRENEELFRLVDEAKQLFELVEVRYSRLAIQKKIFWSKVVYDLIVNSLIKSICICNLNTKF